MSPLTLRELLVAAGILSLVVAAITLLSLRTERTALLVGTVVVGVAAWSAVNLLLSPTTADLLWIATAAIGLGACVVRWLHSASVFATATWLVACAVVMAAGAAWGYPGTALSVALVFVYVISCTVWGSRRWMRLVAWLADLVFEASLPSAERRQFRQYRRGTRPTAAELRDFEHPDVRLRAEAVRGFAARLRALPDIGRWQDAAERFARAETLYADMLDGTVAGDRAALDAAMDERWAADSAARREASAVWSVMAWSPLRRRSERRTTAS